MCVCVCSYIIEIRKHQAAHMNNIPFNIEPCHCFRRSNCRCHRQRSVAFFVFVPNDVARLACSPPRSTFPPAEEVKSQWGENWFVEKHDTNQRVFRLQSALLGFTMYTQSQNSCILGKHLPVFACKHNKFEICDSKAF